MNLNLTNVRKLSRLVHGCTIAGNEEAKKEFHRLGKLVCQEIADAMGLPKDSYEIRSNKGGIAVSGEVTLHGEHIYIQLQQSSIFGNAFMYRYCRDQRDYTGGVNRWMQWVALTEDFELAILKFKDAEKNTW